MEDRGLQPARPPLKRVSPQGRESPYGFSGPVTAFFQALQKVTLLLPFQRFGMCDFALHGDCAQKAKYRGSGRRNGNVISLGRGLARRDSMWSTDAVCRQASYSWARSASEQLVSGPTTGESTVQVILEIPVNSKTLAANLGRSPG